MRLILLLNGYVDPSSQQPTGTQWLLPSGTDAEELRHRIGEGMSSGTRIEVVVVLPNTDQREATLLLNGGLLESALIVQAAFDEVSSPDGSGAG